MRFETGKSSEAELANLLNSYLGLIIADSTYCVPFSILVVRAFMIGLPRELLEAARVDGATLLGTLLRIVIPLSRPAILTAALFSFLFAWGDFLFALTLSTSNTVEPMTLSIYSYMGQYTSQWPELMAAAVFAAVPSAILLILVQQGIRGGRAIHLTGVIWRDGGFAGWSDLSQICGRVRGVVPH